MSGMHACGMLFAWEGLDEVMEQGSVPQVDVALWNGKPTVIEFYVNWYES